MSRVVRVVVAIALALGTAACSDSPSSPSPQGSRFTLRFTNSSFAAGRAVLVTFSRVRAVRSSGDSTDVALTGGAAQLTCDLKKLQSSEGEIAVGPLPPGDYASVHVQVQSATLYLDSPSLDTCAANFRIPSGRTTPIALMSSEILLSSSFRVESGADTTMRISLNSEQSIRADGNGSYSFQPIVTLLSVG